MKKAYLLSLIIGDCIGIWHMVATTNGEFVEHWMLRGIGIIVALMFLDMLFRRIDSM